MPSENNSQKPSDDNSENKSEVINSPELRNSGLQELNDNESEERDKIIEALEAEYTDLKDKILEQRFYWIFITLILVDGYMFTFMFLIGMGSGITKIAFFQLIFLAIVARQCRVDAAVKSIGSILSIVSDMPSWFGDLFSWFRKRK